MCKAQNEDFKKILISGVLAICFILIGFILSLIGMFASKEILVSIGLILLASAIMPAALEDYFVKQNKKEGICSIIPYNEFVELDFRERNDKLADEVFKYAKIYGKKSDTNKDILIVKIVIFDNEIITELPLEEVIKRN